MHNQDQEIQKPELGARQNDSWCHRAVQEHIYRLM